MARGTLVKIIETLGCRYLQYLLKEMQGVLVKGYQVGTHRQQCSPAKPINASGHLSFNIAHASCSSMCLKEYLK